MGYSQNKSDMEKLSWIVDRWVSSNGESTSYEHWEKVSETMFTGSSETVKNGDTLFSEKLKIEFTDGNIYYVADVKHNPEPVKFKLISFSESEAVFENPEHDFPQKITYKHVEGNLHASIEGPGKNNTWKKIDFHMNRIR
jgi:hypothetical protein